MLRIDAEAPTGAEGSQSGGAAEGLAAQSRTLRNSIISLTVFFAVVVLLLL